MAAAQRWQSRSIALLHSKPRIRTTTFQQGALGRDRHA